MHDHRGTNLKRLQLTKAFLSSPKKLHTGTAWFAVSTTCRVKS